MTNQTRKVVRRYWPCVLPFLAAVGLWIYLALLPKPQNPAPLDASTPAELAQSKTLYHIRVSEAEFREIQRKQKRKPLVTYHHWSETGNRLQWLPNPSGGWYCFEDFGIIRNIGFFWVVWWKLDPKTQTLIPEEVGLDPALLPLFLLLACIIATMTLFSIWYLGWAKEFYRRDRVRL